MNVFSTTSNPENSVVFKIKTIWSVDEDTTYDVTCTNRVKNKDYVAVRTLGGSGSITLSNKSYILKKDSILIVKYCDIINYRTYDDRWRFYWFVFDSMVELNQMFYEGLPYEQQEDDIVKECFNSLQSGNAYLASSAFSYLYSKWYVKVNKDAQASNEVNNIISYINSRPIDENITIEEISTMFNISTRNLHIKFLKNIGVSPKKYILDKKLEVIKVLLLTTDMRIYEISQRTGYLSEYYFSKAFKKVCGMSPTEFRKKQNEN